MWQHGGYGGGNIDMCPPEYLHPSEPDNATLGISPMEIQTNDTECVLRTPRFVHYKEQEMWFCSERT